MHPDYIRKCLKQLTYIEQMFIAHVYPVTSMAKLAATTDSVNVINFQQNIEQFAPRKDYTFMGYFGLMIHLIYKALTLLLSAKISYLDHLITATKPNFDIQLPLIIHGEYSSPKFSPKIVSLIYQSTSIMFRGTKHGSACYRKKRGTNTYECYVSHSNLSHDNSFLSSIVDEITH